MSGSGSDRKPWRAVEVRRCVASGLAALTAGLAAAPPARAGEGLWDSALEMLDLKAAPAAPAPGFVERTRPDPADVGYQPTALPHKVSPVPVKNASQIQAAKDALDAARARQLHPGAPKPLQTAKGREAVKAAPAAAD